VNGKLGQQIPFGNHGQKGKGNNRFPAGMTARKAKAKGEGKNRFPSGMTGRKAPGGYQLE
jgi:hypothetical protein